jgi:hypothetical protein
MKLELCRVQFSKKDIIKGVKIPDILNEDLAEILGYHVGDGHLRVVPPEYKLTFSGNKIKDKYYYENYLNPLLKRTFGVPFSLTISKTSDEFRLYMDSKAIGTFLKNVINLPQRKTFIRIPKIIKNASDDIKIAFIRGFIDADGTFYTKNRFPPYPVIKAASSSKFLISDFVPLLKNLGFKPCKAFDMKTVDKRNGKEYVVHAFYLNGRKNFDLWMKKIGFGNEKHLKLVRNYSRHKNNEIF